MNLGVFAGRLGRDAEMRATTNGTAVANFSIAVDVGWGEQKHTLWVACAMFGERGEKLAPYLTKGKSVTVSGDVDLRTFQKRDGSTGAEILCNVREVTLQGGNASAETGEAVARAPAAPRAAQPASAKSEPAPFNDDIPL